ncbi:MAG: hypothetical protein GXP45_06670 [bacterium]|nr:hypothetical protein [bacterium]
MIGGIFLIMLAILFAGIAYIQQLFWPLVIVLDITFLWFMLNMDKKFHRTGYTKNVSSIGAAIVFLMLIPISLVVLWNILVFVFIVIPIVAFGVMKRRGYYKRPVEGDVEDGVEGK